MHARKKNNRRQYTRIRCCHPYVSYKFDSILVCVPRSISIYVSAIYYDIQCAVLYISYNGWCIVQYKTHIINSNALLMALTRPKRWWSLSKVHLIGTTYGVDDDDDDDGTIYNHYARTLTTHKLCTTKLCKRNELTMYVHFITYVSTRKKSFFLRRMTGPGLLISFTCKLRIITIYITTKCELNTEIKSIQFNFGLITFVPVCPV